MSSQKSPASPLRQEATRPEPITARIDDFIPTVDRYFLRIAHRGAARAARGALRRGLTVTDGSLTATGTESDESALMDLIGPFLIPFGLHSKEPTCPNSQ